MLKVIRVLLLVAALWGMGFEIAAADDGYYVRTSTGFRYIEHGRESAIADRWSAHFFKRGMPQVIAYRWGLVEKDGIDKLTALVERLQNGEARWEKFCKCGPTLYTYNNVIFPVAEPLAWDPTPATLQIHKRRELADRVASDAEKLVSLWNLMETANQLSGDAPSFKRGPLLSFLERIHKDVSKFNELLVQMSNLNNAPLDATLRGIEKMRSEIDAEMDAVQKIAPTILTTGAAKNRAGTWDFEFGSQRIRVEKKSDIKFLVTVVSQIANYPASRVDYEIGPGIFYAEQHGRVVEVYCHYYACKKSGEDAQGWQEFVFGTPDDARRFAEIFPKDEESSIDLLDRNGR